MTYGKRLMVQVVCNWCFAGVAHRASPVTSQNGVPNGTGRTERTFPSPVPRARFRNGTAVLEAGNHRKIGNSCLFGQSFPFGTRNGTERGVPVTNYSGTGRPFRSPSREIRRERDRTGLGTLYLIFPLYAANCPRARGMRHNQLN